jgi:hypothetical protein
LSQLNTCGNCGVDFPRKGNRTSAFCGTSCRNADYSRKNADRLKAYNAEYRATRREELAARERRRRAEDGERVRDMERISRAGRRDVINARAAEYRAKNRDRINESIRDWSRRNIDRKLANNRARRARKQGRGRFLVSQRDIERMVNRFGGRCGYCAVLFSDSNPMHVEHVLPLCRGGADGIGNLLPACAACNLQKRDKTVMEWRVWKSRRDLSLV